MSISRIAKHPKTAAETGVGYGVWIAVYGFLLLIFGLLLLTLFCMVRAQNTRIESRENTDKQHSSKLTDIAFAYECLSCNAVQVYDHRSKGVICGGCRRPMREASIVPWNPLAETRMERLGIDGRQDLELAELRAKVAAVSSGAECQ